MKKKFWVAIFFKKNIVPKESFFFAESGVVPIVNNKPSICAGD